MENESIFYEYLGRLLKMKDLAYHKARCNDECESIYYKGRADAISDIFGDLRDIAAGIYEPYELETIVKK